CSPASSKPRAINTNSLPASLRQAVLDFAECQSGAMPGWKMAASNHFKPGIAPYAHDVRLPSSRITEMLAPLDKRMNESLTLLTRVL
ncbi:DUF1484 family protein, partial [Chromobacterium alticapitis]|uniref:DUF1484 family protein n=2 Tax=Pseudomonadota TaxID=1224 RepID=UPI0018ED8494